MSKLGPNDLSYENEGFEKEESKDKLPENGIQQGSCNETHSKSPNQVLQTVKKTFIKIDRPSFNQSNYHIYAQFNKPEAPLKSRLLKNAKSKLACSGSCLLGKLLGFFPFILIFRGYTLSDFFNDVIAGMTVGILNIPQGMAYGLLTNLPPVYGLYTSFFPVIFYFFFGSSRHISIGTFALVSLMVGEVVKAADCENLPLEMQSIDISNSTTAAPDPFDDKIVRCQLGYATAVSFMAGIFQICFALLKADILTEYLSGPITRALTTGAAFHIFTSQLRHVFGYSFGRDSGFLSLIKKYIAFFKNITQTNIASLVTALICLILIYINKRIITPLTKKYLKIPFPIELILLIVITGLSYNFNFASPAVFNMTVVGPIPRGFPVPSVPNFSLISIIAKDAFVIAIVAFIISFSMAKLYSDMEKYKISSNQEMYAYGISASASSFFSCFMPCASLSRSNVQYYSGCKTQMCSLVSCLLLLVVILAVGPLFYSLPNSVLAAIIIFNLQSTFMQFTDLKYLFRVSFLDAVTWMVTCLMVILSNVDIGLGAGVGFAIFSIVLRTQRPKIRAVGNVDGTELYESTKYFSMSKEEERIKVVRLEGSLYYANKAYFSSKLEYANVLTEEDLQKVAARSHSNPPTEEVTFGEPNSRPSGLNLEMTDLVIDCGMVPFVDSDGLEAINKAIVDYKDIGVTVHLASCNEKVTYAVSKAVELGKVQAMEMFVTVHDAVTLLREEFFTEL